MAFDKRSSRFPFASRFVSSLLAATLVISSVPMPSVAYAVTPSLVADSASATPSAASSPALVISYDGNSGVGDMMEPQEVFVSEDDNVPSMARMPECPYSLDGYVFDGWVLSPIAPEGVSDMSAEPATKFLPGQEICNGKVLSSSGSEIDLIDLAEKISENDNNGSDNNDNDGSTAAATSASVPPSLTLYASWSHAPSADEKHIEATPEMAEILADRNNIVDASQISDAEDEDGVNASNSSDFAPMPEISSSLFEEMAEYNAKGSPSFADSDNASAQFHSAPALDLNSGNTPLLALSSADDLNSAALSSALLPSLRSFSAAAISDNYEQPNGSKIESVSVEWVTKDSYIDNSASRLSLRYSSTAPTNITFRLSAAFSGQHNYLPGEVELTVPRQIYRNRSGALIGSFSCGDVPVAPNTRSPWAYVSYPDRIVITNTRTLSAATSAWFDLSYTNIDPTSVNGNIDEYVSDPVCASASIVGDNEEVLTRTSNSIDSTLDTSARVTSAQVRNVGVYDNYPSSFPASLRPADAENYTYVSWFSWGVPTGAQMFDTDMSCSIANGNPSGAFLLGVKTPTGQVVEGSGTSMSSPAARSSFANAAQQTWYSYIYMAVPKSSLPIGSTHTFTCSVNYTLTSRDDREITRAAASAEKKLTPVKWVVPTGHFIITKTGDHTYGTALNKISNGQDAEVTFEVHTRAFGAPWTYQDKNANGIIDEGEIGVYPYSMDSYDDTIKIDHAAADEKSTEFSFSKIDVYSLRISQYERTGTMYEGKVGYINRTSSSSLTLNVDVRVSDGPWTRAAYLTWDGRKWSGTASMDGVSTSGSVVYFPDNVTDYKTSFSTTNGAVEYDVRPTVKVKASAKNIQRAQTLFANSDAPDTIVQNEVWMEAFDRNKVLLATNDYGAQDKIQGASMAARLTKTATAVNEPSKQRVALNYSAKVNLQTNIEELDMYRQILSMQNNMSYETGGTFYDLLPTGIKADLGTLSVSSGDSIVYRQLVPNWRGSNRDMLIVKVEHNPSYKMTSTLGRRGYSDTVSLNFMAYCSFDSIKSIGTRMTNVIAYGSDSENIGTISGYRGEPDNPLYGNNTTSKYAVTGVESLMTGLDENGRKTNSFLYASATTSAVAPSWAMSSLDKTVSVSGEENYSDGLDDNEPVNVREGGEYVYKLSFANPAQDTSSKQLVFYDNLEKFVPDNKQDAGDVIWKGTFKRVDTSALSALGADPIVYYSVRDDLVLDDTDDRSDMDLSRQDIWSATAPDDLSLVKAIAIDVSKKKDGSEFILPTDVTALAYVYMDAPMGEQVDADDPQSVYDKALGENGTEEGKNGGAHAYNNCSCLLVSVDRNGTEGPQQLVRKDYTKVGILPYQLTVSKTFDDDSDRDGIRPESCELELVSGKDDICARIVLSAENNWKATLHVPFRYDYSMRETSSDGKYAFSYTMRTSADGGTMTVSAVNKHEPEKIPLTIRKFWEGDDEDTSHRPTSILVGVYDSTGKKVTTVTLYAKDEWRTTIQVPKYHDHGKELEYFVKEASSPDLYKLGEIQDTSITNIYYPFGDLIVQKKISSATTMSSDQEFTFQLDILDQDGEPVAREWEYEKSTGEIGVIANGKTFTLKGNETFTVKELSCYDTYLVQEIDVPSGWRVFGQSSMTGKVKTHMPSTCVFENIYSTEGHIDISLDKALAGKQLKSGRFQFELTDAAGKVLRRTSNRSDGTVSFNAVKYANADADQSYTYYVSEINGQAPGYIYDDKIYRIDAHVNDNGDGTMSTESIVYLCDTEKNIVSKILETDSNKISNLEFTNAYHASGSTIIEAKKQLDGRELNESEFEFGLYDESGTLIQTLRNDAEGNIVSSPIEFNENDIEKERKYVLKEIPGTDSTVQYSTQEFTYTIMAHDEEDGTLSFTNTVNESPVFKNTLKPGALRVEKETTNGDTQALHNFKVRLSGEPSNDITFDYDNSNEPQKIAFAIYSNDDNSLSFYKRHENEIPKPGDKFDGKTVTDIYTEFEKAEYHEQFLSIYDYEPVFMTPWFDRLADIDTVSFKDKICPISLDGWFTHMAMKQIYGLENLDTTDVTSMRYTFYDCSSLTNFNASKWNTSNVKSTYKMFYHCSSLTSLDLSNFDTSNVADMSYMFYNCRSLSSVDMSGFNTSNVTNMSGMFWDCSALTSLDLNGFDTSNVTNMDSMFLSCSSLMSLDLSNFDTSNVTNMDSMFLSCSSLSSVGLSSFDTSKVTSMSHMFYGCSSLTNIDVSGFNTSKVTNMAGMFYGCSSLTNLDLSSLDTSNVTNMDSMFSECNVLASLDISQFDTSNVTNMSEMFFEARSLTVLDLSSCNTHKVNDMSGMFFSVYGTMQLKTIYVSDLWTTDAVSDSFRMFVNCKFLSGSEGTKYDKYHTEKAYARIDDPGNGKPGYFTYKPAPNATAALSQSRSLVPSNLPLFGDNTTLDTIGAQYDQESTADTSNAIEENSNPEPADTPLFNPLNAVGDYLFGDSTPSANAAETSGSDDNDIDESNSEGSNSDNDVPVGADVITNGRTDGLYALMNENDAGISVISDGEDIVPWTTLDTCEWMIDADWNMTIRPLDGISGTIKGSLYTGSWPWNSYRENIQKIKIEHNVSVLQARYMFYNCKSLTSIDLSGLDTSNLTDAYAMFQSCKSLSNIDLSKFGTSSISDMAYMFYGCESLVNIDVSNFDTSKVTNMYYMFGGCYSLSSLDVSNFDTSKVEYMNGMFMLCRSLSSIDVRNFDTSNVIDMRDMFHGCDNLLSLDLSSFDTSKVTNMDSMFSLCLLLSNLNLSNFDTSSVTNMNNMFGHCNCLSSLVLSSNFNILDANSINFPSPSSECSNYPVTGKWISYNAQQGGPYSPYGLKTAIASAGQDTLAYAGTWVWEHQPTLRYNKNNDNALGEMEITSLQENVTILDCGFTFPHYKFAHWNTKPDGSGTDYYPGDTISDPGTTTPENPYVDLYAQWERSFPIVGYDANGASGSMPNSKVNDSYVIPPCSFYCPGYAFVSWNTQQNGKGTSYRPGEKLDQELDIPSSGNSVSLTLYAQWEEQKVDFDSDTNTYSFSLRGGQSMTFNNVPAGTTYTVYEETQNGWVPIEISGDTGSIEPLSTSVAHFVNDRREKFAQTVIPGNKLLDGKPVAGFVFELIENDSVVATATSDENGLFEFKMEYTESGNHSYIVREKLPKNIDEDGIVYDEHVAEVTIDVTENADGTLNLYSTLPKDFDGEIDKPLDPDELGVSTVAGKYYRVSDSSMSWSVASYPVQILKGNGTAYSTTFSAWNKYIISPGTVDGTWICTTTISGADNIPLNEIIIPNGSYAIVSYEKDGDAQAVEPLGIKVGDILSFSNGISANIEDAAGAGDISIMKPFSKPDGYDVYEKIPVFRTSTTAVDDLSFPLQILSGASVSYPVNAQNCLDATNNPPKSLSVMGPYRAGQNYIDPITNTKSGNYGWSRALFEPVDINGKTYYKFVRYYSTNSTGDDVKPTIDIDGAIVVVYHPNTYTSPLFAAGDIISFDFDLECVARPLTGTGQSWPSNAPVIGNLLFVPKITGASLTDWNKYRIVPSDQHPNCYEIVEKCSDGLSVTSIELTEGEKMVAVPSGDDTFENLRDGALYSFDLSLDAEQASADGIGYAYYIAPSSAPPDGGEDPEPEILTGLSFKNTSKPGSLTISKTVNGTANSVNPDHEFTFKVTLNEGLEDERVEVLKIKAGEQASIDNIPAGTRYKVEETDLPTGYAVSHITNDNGTITGGSHIEVQANNTYQSHGEALISGKKTLLGRELVGNDFTFELVRKSNGTPISTTSNDMGGSFSFIVEADGTGEDFTETYLLRENTSEADISSDLRGKVDFDNRTWTVDVSWHDNGLGVLIPTVSYRSDADDNDEQAEIASFDNTMKTGTLHVEKSMPSISDDMKEFEFEFDLILVGDNGEAYEPISWMRSDGDSSSESYSDHVIYLSAGQSIDIEIPSGVAYRVSERSVDKIVLLSSEGTEGTIEASSTSSAYFENGYVVPPYSAEGEIGIPVSKKLMNGDLADGQFRFVMLAPDGQEYRAYNDVNGVVSFPTLMFDETDDGKEFLYQIFELSGEEGRIIYDMDIRNVLIVPHDNGDGTVSCQMSMLSEDETISAPIDEVKFINQALLDGEVILPGSGSNGAIVLVIALGLLLFWSGYAYRRRKRKAILLFSNT